MNTPSLLPLVLVAVVAACNAPFATLHTAAPVAKGSGELAIAAGPVPERESEGKNLMTRPSLEGQLRYGLTGSTDIGLRLYPIGGYVDFNQELASGRVAALSVDPGAGTWSELFWHGSRQMYPVFLPVLLDLGPRGPATLTLGAKGGLIFGLPSKDVLHSDNDDSSGSTRVLAASLAARWRMGQSTYLGPEIALIYWPDDRSYWPWVLPGFGPSDDRE